MSEGILGLFSDLKHIDNTLSVNPSMLSNLRRKQVKSCSYSREKLFSAMANGKVALFNDYPAPLVRSKQNNHQKNILRMLRNFHRTDKLRIRSGPSGTFKYITSRELIDKWNADRGIFGITDLHIRDSKVEKVIDPKIISGFNLLPGCSEEVAAQEMMTMVVSSAKFISDSHSDAPDGSNHCFAGSKVWLMWDTFDGLKNGLQDCSRVSVSTKCKFNMKSFLKLKSAKWLIISPGETLFLPGDLTHKVITLEKYLGVGSFYVSLPNSLRTLSRWMQHGPLWASDFSNGANDKLVTEIAEVANGTLHRINSAGDRARNKWGYDFMSQSLEAWHSATPKRLQKQLLKVPYFQAYMDRLIGVCV